MTVIHIQDLKPGDIVLVMRNAEPYHVAIYSPQENRISDTIHMGTGFKNSGAIMGTLTATAHLHRNLNAWGNALFGGESDNSLDIRIFRSQQTGLGKAIAHQAEFWMQQGVNYDVRRLHETVKDNQSLYDDTYESQILNALTYLKFAARRATSPIKSPYYPYSGPDVLSVFGAFFLAPSLNLPDWITDWAKYWIASSEKQHNEPKGFNCAGFVLACIAAALLADDIDAATPEQGWPSLKHGRLPENQDTSYAKAHARVKDKLGKGKERHTGLHELLTDDGASLNIDAVICKLSFLAKLHPSHPSIRAFTEGIMTDTDAWRDMGSLVLPSLSKVFDDEAFRQEKKVNRQQTLMNHTLFGKQFGQSAFGHRYYQKPAASDMVSWLTGEIVNDIAPDVDCINDGDTRQKREYVKAFKQQLTYSLYHHWIISHLVLHTYVGYIIQYVNENLYDRIEQIQKIADFLEAIESDLDAYSWEDIHTGLTVLQSTEERCCL